MNEHARRALLEQAVAVARLPALFAHDLCDTAPWLDGQHELSEELGPELLAQSAADHCLTDGDVARFVREYNSLVSALLDPSQVRQSRAYVAFADILASYGCEGLTHADYWLPSDSFSTRHPVIILQDRFRLPTHALERVQTALEEYADLFDELSFSNEDGCQLHVLRPR